MNHKAVDLIMGRFFSYVLVTLTWFVNYCARNKEYDPQEISELQTKIADLRTRLKELP